MAGYNQSTDEPLKPKLKLLPKNSLRQPVVEKILNQMINLVNTIIDQYGTIDEIRIELARELKQSLDERNATFKRNNDNEKLNKSIADKLAKDYHVKANRRNIEKWRLYQETDGDCLYCGNKIELSDFLNGDESDVEHVIPKTKLFDDSFQNKVISHRKCNKAKDNLTAYDYMLTQSADSLHRFEESVAQLRRALLALIGVRRHRQVDDRDLSAKAIGECLKKWTRRPVGGFRLDNCYDKHKERNVYHVEAMA